MISVSNEYKEIMKRPIRNRAFISVGIGIINQNAQMNGKVGSEVAYWSYGDIFNTNQSRIEYATLEENFMKADGSQCFTPENDELMQLSQNGISTDTILGEIKIDFNDIYAIKGLTIEFSSAYPTHFTVKTAEKTLDYTNFSEKFTTNDVLGDTDYIIITPISMVGGNQRLRIKSILMGVGLQYGNQQTKSFSIEEYVSSISEDLPSESMSFSFYDEENLFDVDNENSFIDFLETMQKVTVSFGLELDTGDVEWHQIATQYLKDWKSQKGTVSFNATDRLSQMEDEYTLANSIYERTAYEEAKSIFEDAGLEPDEYIIDDYMHDVILQNPMPTGTHKECLQVLANACRCIIRQDENGKIVIRANFASVLDPEDMQIEANDVAKWGNVDNLFVGSDLEYADMTLDFMKADGSMYFLPEDSNYLDTGYVSNEICDETGTFAENPKISIILPASYSYYGVNIAFGGNAPEELVIHTYKENVLLGSIKFTSLAETSVLTHEFLNFDKMVFEFTKGYPNNRVLVNKISFGSLTDYVLTKTNTLENPTGYKEKRTKSVRCKVYTYEKGENEEPVEIEDNVYAERLVEAVGDIKTIQNPLVSTLEHAKLLAEWVGNYCANNISYDVSFRGEPRLNAADIIHMESDKKSNLQVEITKVKLNFDGTFSGELELRKALKMMGV